MADLTTGANAEVDDCLSYQQYNRIKNHWRQSDPCANLAAIQPGMIVSDLDDEKLYHYQAAACKEILQADTPFGDNNQIIGGDGSDSILIPYEEATNDAIIWGLPVAAKRGLIFCDVADIAANFTGIITASAQPVAWFVDLDLDSYLGIGHQADDKPGIWAHGNVHIQYDANGNVVLFMNGGAGINRIFQIYGWNAAYGSEMPTELYFNDTYDEFFIKADNYSDHEGITIELLEEYQAFRVRGTAGLLGLKVIPNAALGPEVELYDLDSDSILHFAWIADDTPSIYTSGADVGLNIQAAAEKLGFFDVTPVVRAAAIADATGAGDIVARYNELKAVIETYGLLTP